MDTGSGRLAEVLLGALLVADGISVGTGGLSLPLAELAAVLLVVIASFRRPVRSLSDFGILAVLAGGLVAFLAITSLANGIVEDVWLRRLFRIGVLICLVGSMASGRLDLPGIIRGLVVGLVLNIPLFYAGLAPDTYGGVLTGLLGDKNVAGLYYSVIPVLALAIARNRVQRILLIVLATGGTVMTGSRTSLAGLACALVWFAIAPYVGLVFRWIMALVMGFGVFWLTENLPRFGGYFDDRLGSDMLRERIHEASWIKVTETPWHGQGLGQSTVQLEENDWFFHNSYWGLFVEGGWAMLVIVVAAYLVLGMRPFRHALRTPSRIAVEGATLIFFVCASQLGEVFITVTGALVLGAGLLLTSAEAEESRGT